MARFELDQLSPEVREGLKCDLLALADSKLVLANWYVMCVHNGRSLPDFAAVLGMATASYGHTRALYLYLANFGLDYAALERRSAPGELNSMNLLDYPPQSWEDFVAAVFLAEQAMWTFASGFLKNPDRPLSGLIRKIGEESYFHLKYCEGWRAIFAQTANPRFNEALQQRFPSAVSWFGSEKTDALHDSGVRELPVSKLREAFIAEVSGAVQKAQLSTTLASDDAAKSGWKLSRRRSGDVSTRLFNIVQLKDAEAVHH
jgi:1,2-phenylacetyl-CoA epoxidase catalytic subunit